MASTQRNVLALTAVTFEKEYDMKMRNNATAKNLFDSILAATGIRETWYFGLSHVDDMGEEAWLSMDKKIKQQHLNANQPLRVVFKAKYLPKDVSVEVVQSITLRLLFKQIQSDILEEIVYCPADKAVLLASLAAQAKFGDLDDDLHNESYLSNEQILPPKILEQHTLSMQEWELKVRQFHGQHAGLAADEAMMEYLKIAQELEMYGITYYPVYNSKGQEALIGIDALGINFYNANDKFSPLVTFPWPEIDKLSYKKDRFKIRFLDKKTEPHMVRGKYSRTAAKIFDLAAGNLAMHRRRLQPDPLHVQQMKAQRDQEREDRERERVRLRAEMDRRRRVEQTKLEMEERSRKLEEEVRARMEELKEANAKSEELNNKLKMSKDEIDGLETKQRELEVMVENLEKERNDESEQRNKLHQDIEQKMEEIEGVRREAELRAEEKARLEEEIRETKLLMEKTLVQTTENEQVVNDDTVEHDTNEEKMESDAKLTETNDEEHEADGDERHVEFEEEEKSDDNVSPEVTNMEEHLATTKEETFVNAALEGNGNGNVVNHINELKSSSTEETPEIHDPKPETKSLLKDLRSTLTTRAVSGSDTVEDEQYKAMLAVGRSKFKTLSEVRKGNTKRRIDIFENIGRTKCYSDTMTTKALTVAVHTQ